MRRAKLWLAFVAVAGTLAVGAVAAVPGGHTSPVTATAVVARVAILHERTCTGDDGQYRLATQSFAGTVAGDPRLTGSAALFLNTATNTTTGNGTAQGFLTVTETGGGVRFRAALQGVSTGSGGINLQGMLTGKVNDHGTNPGGRLVANFTAVNLGGIIYADIGANGTGAHPAVIQRVGCLAPNDRPAE